VHARTPALALLSTVLLGACGGGGDAASQTSTTAAGPQTSTQPAQTAGDPLALPAAIPRTVSGPADKAAAATIRSWSAALRGGNIKRATSFWGLPAKIQNGTPVLTLSTRDDVRIYNDSLPCGAVLESAGGARGGYTIATFRLTERRGTGAAAGHCGTGVGNHAQTAILVRRGRIVGWYRLPNVPDAATNSGPVV
jgi:hypothetical protein